MCRGWTLPFVSDNKYALGIMQFETRAVANHAQAQMARQWSWAAKKRVRSELHALACPDRSCGAMNSQTWVPNWADGGSARASLGYGRAFCKERGCRDLPLRRRCGGRINWPSQTRWWSEMILDRLLSEDSSSAWAQPTCPPFPLRRTSQKCIPVRRRVLADAFSRKHIYVVGRPHSQLDNSCVVVFTRSPRLLCLGREGWRSGLGSVVRF